MAAYTDSKAFTISYNPEVPCVVMTWRGYVSSEEIRQGSLATLSLLREKKACKVMADTRNMKLITAQIGIGNGSVKYLFLRRPEKASECVPS